MVLRSENDAVIFISDANMSEIWVFSKDVQLSRDVVNTDAPEGNFKKTSRKLSNRKKRQFPVQAYRICIWR